VLHGFGRILHGAWLGLAFNEVAWLLGRFCMEHGLGLHLMKLHGFWADFAWLESWAF